MFCVCVFNLSDRVGQGLDDLLMCSGHHALSVNLDDPVTHTNATSLGDASSHQAAYLRGNTNTQINLCCAGLILYYQGCQDPDLEGRNPAGISVLLGGQPLGSWVKPRLDHSPLGLGLDTQESDSVFKELLLTMPFWTLKPS